MTEVTLNHPKGSSLSILLYGATVISWKSATRRNSKLTERLFVSSKAALDGSKAVRGGIPVVFPCFGPPTHPDHAKLPQHGFARTEVWSWDKEIVHNDMDHTVSVTLTLKPTTKILELFSKPFELHYTVALGEFDISTELRVHNTSTSTHYPPDSVEFQALFHNYIRAPSNEVLVTPLKDVLYYDKTETTEQARANPKTETRSGVDVRTVTDSVYENAPDHCEITWPGGGISLKKDGLKDLVIWNPQAEQGRKIVDMEDLGWEKYVCAEPGFVRGFCRVDPGHTWVGRQTLSIIHEERRMGD